MAVLPRGAQTALGRDRSVATTGILPAIARAGTKATNTRAPRSVSLTTFTGQLDVTIGGAAAWSDLIGCYEFSGAYPYSVSVPILGLWRVTAGWLLNAGATERWGLSAVGEDSAGAGGRETIDLVDGETARKNTTWVGRLGPIAAAPGGQAELLVSADATDGSYQVRLVGELLEAG